MPQWLSWVGLCWAKAAGQKLLFPHGEQEPNILTHHLLLVPRYFQYRMPVSQLPGKTPTLQVCSEHVSVPDTTAKCRTAKVTKPDKVLPSAHFLSGTSDSELLANKMCD